MLKLQNWLISTALALGLAACAQATPPTPEAFKGKVLGTVTVQFDQNIAKASFAPNTRLATRDFNVSINFIHKFSGAFDDDSTKTRYAWATFEAANTSSNDLHNLTMVAVNLAGKGLGLTAIQTLENLNGQAITNPAIAQSIRPMHGIKINGTNLEVDNSKADFQAFSDTEAQSMEDSARTQGLLAQLDDVLEYGFVARNATGGRGIPANTAGQVTLALRMPKPLNATDNPYRFQMTFLLVDTPTVRVSRSQEETTAQVSARASEVNSSEVALIGSDTDTIPGRTTIRLGNARVSSAPQYYIPSQALAFRIDSPIGVIPANQCTTLTASSSDGGSLGSGVIWSMTGQGVLSNQTGTTATFCAPDVATTAAVNINAVLRDDGTKSSTLGLSLQAPASVGVATLSIGGSTVTTGDNTTSLNAQSGALISNTPVTLTKFNNLSFGAPHEGFENVGDAIIIKINKASINPNELEKTFDLTFDPATNITDTDTTSALVRVPISNAKEIVFEAPFDFPSRKVSISSRIISYISQNTSGTEVIIKVSLEKAKPQTARTRNTLTRGSVPSSNLGIFQIPQSITNPINTPLAILDQMVYDCPSDGDQHLSPQMIPVSDVPSSTDFKIPLLLVHGWQGLAFDPIRSGQKLSPAQCYWADFIRNFYKSPDLMNKYVLYSYSYDSVNLGIEINSTILENKIKFTFGSQPIVIVAHSMGGMISRLYMNKNLNNNVRQLVTLGSPFGGVDAVTCTDTSNFICTKSSIDRNTLLHYSFQKLIDQSFDLSSVFTGYTVDSRFSKLLSSLFTVWAKNGTSDLSSNSPVRNRIVTNLDNNRVFAIYGCNAPKNETDDNDMFLYYLDRAIRSRFGTTCTDGITANWSATYGIAHSHVFPVNHIKLTSDSQVFQEIERRLVGYNGPLQIYPVQGTGVGIRKILSRGDYFYLIGDIASGVKLVGNPISDDCDVFVAKVKISKTVNGIFDPNIVNEKIEQIKVYNRPGCQATLDVKFANEINPHSNGIVISGNETFLGGSVHMFSMLINENLPLDSMQEISPSSANAYAGVVKSGYGRIYFAGGGVVGDSLTALPCSRGFIGWINLGNDSKLSVGTFNNVCSFPSHSMFLTPNEVILVYFSTFYSMDRNQLYANLVSRQASTENTSISNISNPLLFVYKDATKSVSLFDFPNIDNSIYGLYQVQFKNISYNVNPNPIVIKSYIGNDILGCDYAVHECYEFSEISHDENSVFIGYSKYVNYSYPFSGGISNNNGNAQIRRITPFNATTGTKVGEYFTAPTVSGSNMSCEYGDTINNPDFYCGQSAMVGDRQALSIFRMLPNSPAY